MDKVIVLIRRKDRIDYILNGVCTYYGITLDELKNSWRHRKTFNRKRYAIKLLRDVADCSLKETTWALDSKSPANIWYLYDGLTYDMDNDTTKGKAYKREYADLLKFMNL